MSNFVVCGVFVAFQNDICKFKWVVGDMWMSNWVVRGVLSKRVVRGAICAFQGDIWMSKWVVCGVCFEFQGDK